MRSPATLRPYTVTDEAAAIELWQQTWQEAYPAIDFAARVDWWRERWRSELVPSASIVVAESSSLLVGFVTVNAATGYQLHTYNVSVTPGSSVTLASGRSLR